MTTQPRNSGAIRQMSVHADCSWLFLGGCPRSGTTLLELIMSTHPAIGITNEVSFFSVLEALRPVFSREASFNNWQERTKSTKENWTKTTLEPYIPRYDKCAGRMVRAMYEAHFESPTIRYFGDKLPYTTSTISTHWKARSVRSI